MKRLESRLRLYRRSFFLGLLALSVYQCAGNQAQTVPRTINFAPKPDTNSGRPFYIIIRSVSEKEFLSDSYRKIANLAFAQSADPSVLSVSLMWPQKTQRVKVEVPKGKGIGIYCMFTRPSDQWKLVVPEPSEQEYKTVLNNGSIFMEVSQK